MIDSDYMVHAISMELSQTFRPSTIYRTNINYAENKNRKFSRTIMTTSKQRKSRFFFLFFFFVSKFRNVRELWESHINSILKASISFWTVIYWIFQQWKRRHLFRKFWSKLPVTMWKYNGQAPTMSFFDWNNKPSILMWNVEHTI